jgi:hypothetical protein
MKTIRKILIDKPTLVMVAINLLLLFISIIYQLYEIQSLDPIAKVAYKYLPGEIVGEVTPGSSSQLYQLVLLPIITSIVALIMMVRFLQFNRRAFVLMVLGMNALVLLFCTIVAYSFIILNK